MATRMESVKPEVLVWARTSAHLDEAEAARRAGVPEAQLAKWEQGEQSPTVIQLRKLAQAYDRSLGALFMPQPPDRDQPVTIPDFRRQEVNGKESATLRRAILAANQRLAAIDEVVSEGFDLPFKFERFSLNFGDTGEIAGAKLREELRLGELSRRSNTPEELVRALIDSLASRGHLAMQVQKVAYGEFRGLSLRGDNAAVILLNGSDFARGKVFTLLHELVHISIRSNALCDLSRRQQANEERFCDDVASAALMPETFVRERFERFGPVSYEALREFGDTFGPGPSAESVLLRLVKLKLETWDTYNDMRPIFQQAYEDHRRETGPSKGEKSPPIYYPLKVRDLGRPFIEMMTRAHEDGLVSSRDLTNLLDISYSNLGKLRNQARHGKTTV